MPLQFITGLFIVKMSLLKSQNLCEIVEKIGQNCNKNAENYGLGVIVHDCMPVMMRWMWDSGSRIHDEHHGAWLLAHHDAWLPNRHGPRYSLCFCIFLVFSRFLSVIDIDHFLPVMKNKKSDYYNKRDIKDPKTY